VLTMVTRDDLPDGGAGHLARTVGAIRRRHSKHGIELLISDLNGDEEALETVAAIEVAIFGHNIETTAALTPGVRDGRCSFEGSLEVLNRLGRYGTTKSALLVGMGEDDAQVRLAMDALRKAGVDLLAIGQYLQPSPAHLPVHRYVPPEIFEAYREAGLKMGFTHVAAGPLVRSSYRAGEGFAAAMSRIAAPFTPAP